MQDSVAIVLGFIFLALFGYGSYQTTILYFSWIAAWKERQKPSMDYRLIKQREEEFRELTILFGVYLFLLFVCLTAMNIAFRSGV